MLYHSLGLNSKLMDDATTPSGLFTLLKFILANIFMQVDLDTYMNPVIAYYNHAIYY